MLTSPTISLSSLLQPWALLMGEDQNLKEKYLSSKNPVVFCHGLLGFGSIPVGPGMTVDYWIGIREVLEKNGTEVLIASVPGTSSCADRAKALRDQISATFPGRSVHLIGHSMGGLDCRFLASQLPHPAFSVLSVTTICTPHRGSSFANYLWQTVGRIIGAPVLGLLQSLPFLIGDGKAFEFLTVENMSKFNMLCPDVPGVKYFSWGASYAPGLMDRMTLPHAVVMAKEGPNDGLVSVESSKWGTYLGTLTDVDHLEVVGWDNPAPDQFVKTLLGNTKFHPAKFYLGIVDMLARQADGVRWSQSAFVQFPVDARGARLVGTKH